MLKIMRSSWLAVAACGLLVACGQSEDPQPKSGDGPTPTVPTPEPPAPNPVDPAPAPVQPTDNLWSSAPLSVRTTNANLRLDANRRGEFVIATTLRYENGSDRPIAINLADDELNLQLDNGITAKPSYFSDISVFKPCRSSATLQDCSSEARDKFVDIDPHSSLDVNITVHGRYVDTALAELKSVEKGVVNFRMFLLDPGATNRTLNVSLSNVPITNRIE